MSQAPIWPVATDALIADTTHLSRDEFGAYLLLLMAQWRSNGKPLPNDDARLGRIARATDREWRRMRPVLSEFFQISSTGWSQKRIEKDFKNVSAKIAKNRENASKGGEAKALKNNNVALANATHSAEPNGGSGFSETLPIHIHEPKPFKKEPSSLRSDGAHPALPSQGQQASEEHDLGKIPKCLDRRAKPPPSEPKPKPKRRQLSALPETCPDNFERAWALNFWRQNQRDDLADGIDNQVQQFRDHHKAKGSRMADWTAAWRTWVRNATRFNRPQGAIQIGREPAPSEADVMAAFEREQVRGAARDAG